MTKLRVSKMACAEESARSLTLVVLSVLLVIAVRPAQAQTEIVLYSFCSDQDCTDGKGPYVGLIRDAKGNLYGTTDFGGGPSGYGTVFKLDHTGQEMVLAFTGGADGATPYAGLVRDAAGNFYSTTYYGGANGGGTVFKLDGAGHETVLYSFCSASNCTDGANPQAAVIMDAAGNLYSTTFYGGSNGGGTVFKL